MEIACDINKPTLPWSHPVSPDPSRSAPWVPSERMRRPEPADTADPNSGRAKACAVSRFKELMHEKETSRTCPASPLHPFPGGPYSGRGLRPRGCPYADAHEGAG